MKKRIAYIISQFPETHETFILREIIELKRRGIEVFIFSLKKNKDEVIHQDAVQLIKNTFYIPFFFSSKLIMANIHFFSIKPFKYLYLLIYFFYQNISSIEDILKTMIIFPKSIYIASIIKEHNIRQVHAHWATIPTSAALLISKIIDIPYTFTAHAWDIYFKPSMLTEKIQHAKIVVTCTRANKRYMEDICKNDLSEKIFVNYHGIDINRFNPEKKDSSIFRLMAIGRLVEVKGFEYLIKACYILRQKGIKFNCFIIGDGYMRDRLEKMKRDLELDPFVTIGKKMSQEELLPLLSKANLFIAPSVIAKNNDRDGIPNVIIEAMALEVPVIGTNISGIPEIVIDRETGLLIPQRDENALAEAIEILYKYPELRERLGSGGRKKVVRDFNIEKNVSELADMLLS